MTIIKNSRVHFSFNTHNLTTLSKSLTHQWAGLSKRPYRFCTRIRLRDGHFRSGDV